MLKRISESAAAAVLAVALAGCAGPTTANIVDVGQDRVRVQVYGEDAPTIQAAADRGCGAYRKRPIPQGWRCLDTYCVGKEFLWSCVD